ncbi:MAG TPA: response regulator [Gaiellaceae bacterium]|jgi:CheY-like chemotaxis protein|nr:response regulator [Gaiellaceae bacterium]
MSSPPSVLVCDDEPNLRELIRLSLGPRYAFVEAADGEQALALARALRPQLVILDLMMPRLNGLDVLSKLKADPELMATPVLVVTAQPASEEEARANGADGVIVKPFGPEELAELAAGLVGAGR